jgi:phosphoribosylaminoimidazole (AIR) synthetase
MPDALVAAKEAERRAAELVERIFEVQAAHHLTGGEENLARVVVEIKTQVETLQWRSVCISFEGRPLPSLPLFPLPAMPASVH